MKRLYRVQQGRQLAGVCTGLGKYFEVDPVIFRVLFVFLTFFHGSGILLYVILILVMPQEPQTTTSESQQQLINEAGQPTETKTTNSKCPTSNAPSSFFAILIGVILILIGLYFLLEQFNISFPFIHYYRRYFWENLIAFTLIITGLYFIFRRC